jgi:uncharacterized protein YecE (DUF72 family)
MSLHLGLGSWADPEYTGVLYPKGLPAKERLRAYATHFKHVEVNSSYYATPRPQVVVGWVEQTPPGFTFDIKLHRAFSQSPEKTARSGELVDKLLTSIEPLLAAKKFGAFLLVLPPSFGPGQHRLEELTVVREKLQPHALAVELRHSGWVSAGEREKTLAYFRRLKLTWVAVDMPRIKESTIMPPIDEVTDPALAYLRLHGRNPHWLAAKTAEERHVYPYPESELKEIAARVKHLAAQAAHVHVIANNHAEDFAPKAALALKELLR